MVDDITQVRWGEIKSQVKNHWRKLTDDDLSQLDGGTDGLVSLLRSRYGYGKTQAEIEIQNWLHELNPVVKK